jgi:hypothetical protein
MDEDLANQGRSARDEDLVNVGLALVTCGEPAEVDKPCQGAFEDLALPAQTLAAVDPSPGHPGLAATRV